MDMRYHWIRDKLGQRQYDVEWQPGLDNMGDYFTKNHSPAHHRCTKPKYLRSYPQIQLVM